MLILTFTFNATPITNQGQQHSDRQNPSAWHTKRVVHPYSSYFQRFFCLVYCVLFSLVADFRISETIVPTISAYLLWLQQHRVRAWQCISLRLLYHTHKLWFTFSIVATRRALMGRSFLFVWFVVSSDIGFEPMAVAFHVVGPPLENFVSKRVCGLSRQMRRQRLRLTAGFKASAYES